jgi:hypothetical protein
MDELRRSDATGLIDGLLEIRCYHDVSKELGNAVTAGKLRVRK